MQFTKSIEAFKKAQEIIPHEVHPEPILCIDYENGMLTLELRYKYAKFDFPARPIIS